MLDKITLAIFTILISPTVFAGKPSSISLCYAPSPLIQAEASGKVVGGPLAEVMLDIFKQYDAKLEVHLILLPWKRCQAVVAQGKMDGIMRLVKSAEREKVYEFSTVLVHNYEYFAYLKSRYPQGIEWNKPEDLTGFKIGYPRGNPINSVFNKVIDQSLVMWEVSESETTNIKKLLAKRVDIIVVEGTPKNPIQLEDESKKFIEQSQLKAMKKPHRVQPFYMGLSKKSAFATELDKLNLAIEKVKASGKMDILLDW